MRRRWQSRQRPALRPTFQFYVGRCRVAFHRDAFIWWPWYVCVAVHELGHALAAVAIGARVRSVVIGPARPPNRSVGGWITVQGANRRRRPTGLRLIAIALGGPVTSIIVGACILAAAVLSGSRTTVLALAGPAAINLSMGVVNLFPRRGFDGAVAFQGWIEWRNRRR